MAVAALVDIVDEYFRGYGRPGKELIADGRKTAAENPELAAGTQFDFGSDNHRWPIENGQVNLSRLPNGFIWPCSSLSFRASCS